MPKDFYACLTNCVTLTLSLIKKGARRPIVRTKEVINDVRQRMEQDPTKHTK
jgi:DNA-binding transcriptional regulator GbsR (MarR family)